MFTRSLFFVLAIFCFFPGKVPSFAQTTDKSTEGLETQPFLPRSGDCSDQAIRKRKEFVLAHTASVAVRQNYVDSILREPKGEPNGKHLIPIALALLSTDRDSIEAKEAIVKAMRFRGRDNMFTKIRAAQAFHYLRPLLSKQEISRFEQEMTSYPGFFGYGTENHIAMKRMAGLLFGQSFPEADFVHDLTGEQVKKECMAYMQRYGRAVYGSSNSEFLSHIYFPVHMEAWADAYEYGEDPVVRLMARAILDWFFANAALNYHHRFVNGPLHRATYGGIEQYDKHALSRLLWMYGADTGETFRDLSAARMPAPVISVALTDYIPHEAIRNILAKRVELPFTVEQACANKAYIQNFCQNNLLTQKIRGQYPHRKSLFRTVYIKITHEIYSSIPTTVPFTASWPSENPFNYILAAHPYWFTKKKWSEEEAKWGFRNNIENKDEIEGTYFMDDDLFGFSPCFQMVQEENAAILFYYIPEIDPFKEYRQKGGSASDRLEELIQECFIYIPRSVEERVKNEIGFFIRDGKTYIAVIPFSKEASWKESVRKAFFRIGIPGELTGFAIELGDLKEYGSFKEFINRFSRDQLDLGRLNKMDRLARYTSTRGNVVSIRHTGFDTGLPESTINGTKVDFETYPSLESPYATSKHHVLDVNDGKTGFTVDWRKEHPAYSYYRIEQGKRQVIKTIWVENGEVKKQYDGK